MRTRKPPCRGRASLIALAAVASLAAVPAVSLAERADTEGSVTIKIEAETSWWGHNEGGSANSIATCSESASGGKALAGLDTPGDWAMLEALVPEPMFFKISLRSAEDTGLRAKFAMEFLPLGPGVSPGADTLTTLVGRGAG